MPATTHLLQFISKLNVQKGVHEWIGHIVDDVHPVHEQHGGTVSVTELLPKLGVQSFDQHDENLGDVAHEEDESYQHKHQSEFVHDLFVDFVVMIGFSLLFLCICGFVFARNVLLIVGRLCCENWRFMFKFFILSVGNLLFCDFWFSLVYFIYWCSFCGFRRRHVLVNCCVWKFAIKFHVSENRPTHAQINSNQRGNNCYGNKPHHWTIQNWSGFIFSLNLATSHPNNRSIFVRERYRTVKRRRRARKYHRKAECAKHRNTVDSNIHLPTYRLDDLKVSLYGNDQQKLYGHKCCKSSEKPPRLAEMGVGETCLHHVQRYSKSSAHCCSRKVRYGKKWDEISVRHFSCKSHLVHVENHTIPANSE